MKTAKTHLAHILSVLLSLIAIMLGRLGMSVDECSKAYAQISDRVFQKKHHRLKNVRGELQGRFDSNALQEAVKDILRSRDLPEDTLLQDKDDAPCKV